LGGRVAEELVFGDVTTGASDDFERVTKMAYAQVRVYGMSERVGHLSFPKDQGIRFYSQETSQMIDEEVRRLIQNAYNHTVKLLTEKREGLEKVALLLLEREVISAADLVRLLGERPVPIEPLK